MMTPDAETNEVMSFGPFSLVASERRLTRNGVPVEITGRAYDILVVLATNNPSKPMADPSEIAKLAVSRSSRRLDCTRFRYSAGTSWLLPSASLLTPPRRIWLDRP
jgi:hypothetical protein